MHDVQQEAGTASWHVAGVPDGGFRHVALLAGSQEQYLAEVSGFVRAALARGEPVLVAVPAFRAGPLRQLLGAGAGQVTWADMAEMGRNPARIIPALTAFARDHAGARISCVGECAWPGRTGPELTEAIKQEALANLAFRAMPVTALCPFDRTGLPAGVLAMAGQVHPLLAGDGTLCPSSAYLGADGIPQPCLQPLPDPPADAEALRYQQDMQPVRALTRRRADRCGLPADRADNLTLAVSELAANTLRHSPDGGTLRIWHTPAEMVCQITDQGWIEDPLAGRRPPVSDEGGHGLWLVNEVCDLVERRSGPSGTTIRLHMSLTPAEPAAPPPASRLRPGLGFSAAASTSTQSTPSRRNSARTSKPPVMKWKVVPPSIWIGSWR
jgi:anti-sigma regulatory factor (Ser/Thr protein kinase)